MSYIVYFQVPLSLTPKLVSVHLLTIRTGVNLPQSTYNIEMS